MVWLKLWNYRPGHLSIDEHNNFNLILSHSSPSTRPRWATERWHGDLYILSLALHLTNLWNRLPLVLSRLLVINKETLPVCQIWETIASLEKWVGIARFLWGPPQHIKSLQRASQPHEVPLSALPKLKVFTIFWNVIYVFLLSMSMGRQHPYLIQ